MQCFLTTVTSFLDFCSTHYVSRAPTFPTHTLPRVPISSTHTPLRFSISSSFIVGILIAHRRFGLPNSWRNFFETTHVCRRRPFHVIHPTSAQFHPLVLTTHVAVRIVRDKHVHLLLRSINVSCFYLAMMLRLLCVLAGTRCRN